MSSGRDITGERWWSLREGKGSFQQHFKVILGFCGALATEVMGKATVDLDFSKISIERNDYQRNLTDLSLKSIFQAKQFSAFRELVQNWRLKN